jgi:cytochrome c biogenesis protein CcdA
MMSTLLLSLVVIALLDSLNPSLFIAQFFLLTTPQPVPRILSYIAGVLVVNFGGGLLILVGLRGMIADFFSSVSTSTYDGLQIVVGVAILLFGLWYRPDTATGGEIKKPRSWQPVHTFLFGMVVMLNEITTALPYFVAIERIAQAQLGSVGNVLALVLYNAIFSVPLFGFLGLFVAYHQHFLTRLDRISRAAQVWVPRLTKYLSILFGALLALNAISRFILGTELFG